jgi:oligopeptide/dipeptide ABC transporter ATP-binding protein
MTEPLVSLSDLHVDYRPSRAVRASRRRGIRVRAVDGVDLEVNAGEVLALVGESGSGKTTLAHALTRLVEPSAGRIAYRGSDITRLRGADLRRLRRRFQIIFQDPYESLDPRQSVGDIVAEPLLIHGIGTSAGARLDRVHRALRSVGLAPPEEFATRYPHQLSGGQRQRVSIAAAMILEPELVIADEPVSMLDVSLRAGILRLMLDLRASRGFAYLFITHDLSLAWVFADRIAVMYLGRIVELGRADEIIRRPRHPYTQALVSVIPVPSPRARRRQVLLAGETPSPIAIPSGCRFHPRCPLRAAMGNPEVCERVDPRLEATGEGHTAACHFSDALGREPRS